MRLNETSDFIINHSENSVHIHKCIFNLFLYQHFPALWKQEAFIHIFKRSSCTVSTDPCLLFTILSYFYNLLYRGFKKNRIHNDAENFILASLCTWCMVSRWYISDIHVVAIEI